MKCASISHPDRGRRTKPHACCSAGPSRRPGSNQSCVSPTSSDMPRHDVCGAPIFQITREPRIAHELQMLPKLTCCIAPCLVFGTGWAFESPSVVGWGMGWREQPLRQEWLWHEHGALGSSCVVRGSCVDLDTAGRHRRKLIA